MRVTGVLYTLLYMKKEVVEKKQIGTRELCTCMIIYINTPPYDRWKKDTRAKIEEIACHALPCARRLPPYVGGRPWPFATACRPSQNSGGSQ